MAIEAKEDQKAIDKAEEEVDSQAPPDEQKPAGKLIVAEEIEEGHVSWPARRFSINGLSSLANLLLQ